MILNIYTRVCKKILAGSFLLWFFVADIVWAQDYVPLEALPGVTDTGTNLTEYLSAIFNLGIGLAGVFAVLMIVVGGVQYIGGAASPSARSEAKNRITNAILGLLLATSSWLILYIINPDLIKNTLSVTSTLVSLSPPSVSTPEPAPVTSPVPTPTPVLPAPVTSPVVVTPPSPVFVPPVFTPTPPTPLPPVDTTNDYSMVKDCISREASGVCAPADINSDGVIGFSDLLSLSRAYKYNINDDKIIDFTVSPVVNYCFFKVNTESVPNPNCIDNIGVGDTSDGKDDRYDVFCSPSNELNEIVFSFNTECATNNYGSNAFSINEFNDFKQVVMNSLSSSKQVNLRTLYNNLFSCVGDEEGCNIFPDNNVLRRVTYSTFVKYDTNNDGIADFNGDDPIIDFNGDGTVDELDNKFMNFLDSSVFGSGGFVPFEFVLGSVEAFLFDGTGFTDRQIIEFCINKTAFAGCAMADIDKNCAGTTAYASCLVTQEDLNKFDAEVPVFDINNDGVVNFSRPIL